MFISSLNMNIPALMLFLKLIMTVCSRPHCDPSCTPTEKYHKLHFKHVSELQHSSVSPWDIQYDRKADREPENIPYAQCKDCSVEHMIAKPIFLQVSVYERTRNGTVNSWCKCPFNLAVGCTCVRKH